MLRQMKIIFQKIAIIWTKNAQYIFNTENSFDKTVIIYA